MCDRGYLRLLKTCRFPLPTVAIRSKNPWLALLLYYHDNYITLSLKWCLRFKTPSMSVTKTDTNMILCKQQGAVEWRGQVSDGLQALCGDRSVTSYKRQMHKAGMMYINTWLSLLHFIPFAPVLSYFMWLKEPRTARNKLTLCRTVSDHEADFSQEIPGVQMLQGSFCWLETMGKQNNTVHVIGWISILYCDILWIIGMLSNYYW